MRNLQRNQSGFSVIEIILVLLALLIMGGAGFLVYRNSHKKPAASSTPAASTATSKAATPAPAAVDPTAAWTAYSSATGKFSLRYPTTWVRAANAASCEDSILLLGPTAASVGHCNSESGGEILISSMDGDHQTDYQLDHDTKDVVKTAVTVSGVVGQKITATATASTDEIGAGPAADSKLVHYIFFTGGKTYLLQYSQAPTYPDALSDFNLLVTNTFKFTP